MVQVLHLLETLGTAPDTRHKCGIRHVFLTLFEQCQKYVSPTDLCLVQTDPCLVLGVPSTGRTPIRGLLTDTFAQVMIYELYIESQIQMALHAYVILFFTSCKSYD